MDLYIMEAKKYMDIGYAPLGKAKVVHVSNWAEAKRKAKRYKIYAISHIFVGAAITEKGFIDTTKPFFYSDGDKWKSGNVESE